MMNWRSRFPFTAAQWQELEHQALIYKYMASGIPIPPELLFNIKRSCLDSPFSSKLFPCQPSHMGWSCFQMGLGRKIDPEPGRCRRTDGKKWRCSKEAYPDSKYCERHMHRGKNRSRKPVELATTTSNITNTPSTTPTLSSITKNNSPSSLPPPPSSHSLSLLPPEKHQQNPLYHPGYQSTHNPNYQFPSSHTSSRSHGLGFLDSGGSSSFTNIDYRNRDPYGLKAEVNEHAFFSEPSGSIGNLSNHSLDDNWQLTPLAMSSSSNSSSSKQRSLSSLHSEYSYLQLQSLGDHDAPTQHKQYHQSYPLESTRVEKEEPKKTVHRFFDEWPPKSKDSSWLDLGDKFSSGSVSTTRLSISIPSSSYDFPIFNSRTHNDS